MKDCNKMYIRKSGKHFFFAKRSNLGNTDTLGTGQKFEGGGRAGAKMGRAMVFHASTKGRVKQFGACH